MPSCLNTLTYLGRKQLLLALISTLKLSYTPTVESLQLLLTARSKPQMPGSCCPGQAHLRAAPRAAVLSMPTTRQLQPPPTISSPLRCSFLLRCSLLGSAKDRIKIVSVILQIKISTANWRAKPLCFSLLTNQSKHQTVNGRALLSAGSQQCRKISKTISPLHLFKHKVRSAKAIS